MFVAAPAQRVPELICVLTEGDEPTVRIKTGKLPDNRCSDSLASMLDTDLDEPNLQGRTAKWWDIEVVLNVKRLAQFHPSHLGPRSAYLYVRRGVTKTSSLVPPVVFEFHVGDERPPRVSVVVRSATLLDQLKIHKSHSCGHRRHRPPRAPPHSAAGQRVEFASPSDTHDAA